MARYTYSCNKPADDADDEDIQFGHDNGSETMQESDDDWNEASSSEEEAEFNEELEPEVTLLNGMGLNALVLIY